MNVLWKEKNSYVGIAKWLRTSATYGDGTYGRPKKKFTIICPECGSKECSIATDLSMYGKPLRTYHECNDCGFNDRKYK